MKNLLRGVNLYLIGMMGVGKTTIGQILAQQLGYQFFDTDAVIEQVTKQSIADIFAASGEAEFRILETQVLAELSAYTGLAIATGGGIVVKQENWSYLRHGVVVWLDVPLSQLQQRLQQDTSRPLLQDPNLEATLQKLFEARRSLYAQADVQVESTNATPEQVAAQVIEQLQQVIKPEVKNTLGER
jgi:shikimate kinase